MLQSLLRERILSVYTPLLVGNHGNPARSPQGWNPTVDHLSTFSLPGPVTRAASLQSRTLSPKSSQLLQISRWKCYPGSIPEGDPPAQPCTPTPGAAQAVLLRSVWALFCPCNSHTLRTIQDQKMVSAMNYTITGHIAKLLNPV